MRLVGAFIRRDWQVMLTRRPALIIDVAAVVVSALVFYYLAEFVARGQEYFPFVLAGLTIVRIHAAVPRVLALTTGRIADGSLEILVSGRSRPATVLTGEGAFELLRGLVLSIALLLVAVVLLGADINLTAPGLAAIGIGLLGATLVLLALTVALLALLMVLREAGAVSSLSAVFLPIFAGVYFPIAILPAPLEQLARVLPFHFPVDVIRAGMAGEFPGREVGLLAGACAVSLVLTLALARPAVQHARRAGRLALE